MKDKIFFRRKAELLHRVNNIMGGLNSMGLNVVQLDTQSLLELYYNSYNPVTSANQSLVDIEQLRVNK